MDSGSSSLPREVIFDRARGQLRRLRENEQNIEANIALCVETMRIVGASWQTVGDALGVSKQAASRKYGALDQGLRAIGVIPEDKET